MTKINYEFVKKIFNRELELKKNSDKIKLSQYAELIPMYDIYSDNIYPIEKENIYYRLIDCHYRFITEEVRQWILNKLNKEEENMELKKKYKKNINIIDNYDLETLEKTSYQTLYKYSPELGLKISICKRKSFNKYATHLKPYYTLNELIKLGMNNNIIDSLDPKNLVDRDLHYNICKKVSGNDISYKIINKHMKHIIDNKLINWITYYSMTGSYIFNQFLRGQLKSLPSYLFEGIKKINNVMNTIDSFDQEFYLYRFLWDDKFVRNLKIGDNFTENGFLSTTRDPFYAPGSSMDFGMILIKINIPKDEKGIGLFMENFSMFPAEEEFLIKPNCKLELIAKDDNFKYYHTDKNFENKVKKKYEFKLLNNKIDISEIIKSNKIKDDKKIPEINLDKLEISGIDRISLFNYFIKLCDSMEQFRYDNKIFICEWFDSTNAYQDMYFNKTEDGFSIQYYDNGYPLLSFEFGDIMVVNFKRSFIYYDDIKEIDNKYLEKITSLFSKIFKYDKAYIYFQYYNFTQFKDNYKNEKKSINNYFYTNLFCYPIYKYFKNNEKMYDSKYYNYNFGYWKLDKISKEKVPKDIIIKLPKELRKDDLLWKDLLIEVIEKYFYLYKRMESWFNFYHDNAFKKTFVEFDSILYLKDSGFKVSDVVDIKHNIKDISKNKFKMTFDRVIRRPE